MSGPNSNYIFQPPSEIKARQWSAALNAASIPCRLRKNQDGKSQLIVSTRHINPAAAEIAAYESVNCGWPPESGKSGEDEISFSRDRFFNECLPVIIAAVLMPIWHSLLVFGNRWSDFVEIGAAKRIMILQNGEAWRLTTALTLHADAAHTAGNTAWSILFGCALALRIGTGATLFLGLLSGISGNYIAALITTGHRSSIGASTAVLGLLGILAGLRFIQKTQFFQGEFTRRGLKIFYRRRWMILMAALAVLAMIGAAPHTDLAGHLAGFICGLFLAPAAYFASHRRDNYGFQILMLSGFIFLLSGSWIWAIFSI